MNSATQITQNILLYVLMNNVISSKGKWIMANLGDSEVANTITNYYNDTLYVFNKTEKPYSLLNKNIQIINGTWKDTMKSFSKNTLSNDEYISFIYINCYKYHDVKEILYSVYNKIKEETIIIFNNLVYFNDNILEGLKALYEFLQEYEIKIEWLFVNNPKAKLKENQIVAIKIISTTFFNNYLENIDYMSEEYEKFNWIFYTTHHQDLIHISTKEEAYRHWDMHGKYENRICEPPISEPIQIKDDVNYTEYETFDWETYLELNRDLKESGLITRDEAVRHWIHHGKTENREYQFDWCSYVKQHNLIPQSIDTKIKAINHWLDYGKKEISNNPTNNENNIDINDEMFNWKFYVTKYSDLKHLDNEKSAYAHWKDFGKAERRVCNDFIWTTYLLHNKDLLDIGINTEALAKEHWIKYGKKENRKM
jgi:hypothetical protein